MVSLNLDKILYAGFFSRFVIMNKGRRNELAMLKYKKRIHRFVRGVTSYTTRTGKTIQNPKAIDVINDNGQFVYKTTSTPCSCSACQQPEKKYSRSKFKKQTRSIQSLDV